MEALIINYQDLTIESQLHLENISFDETVKELHLKHDKFAYKIKI